MRTIETWKEILKDKSISIIQKRLELELESIKFLESIYETGGENSFYSDEFKLAAHKERQDICQLTSACYSLLRERGVNV